MPVINEAMKRSQSVDSFLSGKLASVDVRKIEQELTRLWTKASDTDEDHPQVVKACSGNLILYTNREDAETTDANMLDEILLSHPSRAILAISREAQERKLAAWVTARCHMASGSRAKQICSEQITILAEGQVENELVSLIDSLLLGDLPVFLWWSIEDLSGEKLGPLLGRVRRLIVDSSRAPYSFAYLRDLHQIVESTSTAIAVSDLNWRRLTGIRSAIAEEFERSPFSLESLKSIRKIKISSCGQELQDDTCSLQALLLIGWIASRLRWQPSSFARENETTSLARYEANGQTLDVEFRKTVLDGVAPGAIFEIEIELADKKKLHVSRDSAGEEGSLLVTVSENGKRVHESIADDSNLDYVRLMGIELEDLGADKVFEESLESAFDLVHLLEDGSRA